MIDGRIGPPYEGIGDLEFSPDGRHLGYVAREGSTARLIVDGTGGSPHDAISEFRFAPSGPGTAYLARDAGRWFMIHGDTRLGPYASARALTYALGGSLIFVAGDGATERVVIDDLVAVRELRDAIEQDKLLLHYQPKIDFKTARIVGVEALLRWPHPNRGWISPDHFIPFAEKAGLVHTLTLWVLRAAVNQARQWKDAGIDIGIAVNVSARDLEDVEVELILSDLVVVEKRATFSPMPGVDRWPRSIRSDCCE